MTAIWSRGLPPTNRYRSPSSLLSMRIGDRGELTRSVYVRLFGRIRRILRCHRIVHNRRSSASAVMSRLQLHGWRVCYSNRTVSIHSSLDVSIGWSCTRSPQCPYRPREGPEAGQHRVHPTTLVGAFGVEGGVGVYLYQALPIVGFC